MNDNLVTGILWWKPKQWKKAKEISSDSHVFDDTYEEWKEGAEKALKNFRDLRFKVYKIEIDLDELVEWCNDEGMPLNSEARSKFTTMKVQERHRKIN